ncbi:glycosyltransferase family protein [Amnibacterium kyonggiense]|nr:glycosyltransferase [Amnibacterium kyonggiense]
MEFSLRLRRQSLDRFDLLVAVKCVNFPQEPLLEFNADKRVHVSFDDLGNPENVSDAYLRHEPYWDAIVTTKSYNVPEIRSRGGVPIFINNAYDPRLHFSDLPLSARRFDIGFIGARRRDRADLVRVMHTHFAEKAIIYGPGWRSERSSLVEVRPATGAAGFVKAAESFKASLVLLNSDNRDLQTARTFEAAAAGNLVLAKDTPEHREIYSVNEAVFFNTPSDLADLTARMDQDPTWAQRVATAGHDRVVGGNNAYFHRAMQIISEI